MGILSHTHFFNNFSCDGNENYIDFCSLEKLLLSSSLTELLYHRLCSVFVFKQLSIICCICIYLPCWNSMILKRNFLSKPFKRYSEYTQKKLKVSTISSRNLRPQFSHSTSFHFLPRRI